ncbi:MAG: rRNA maturation RNase YbeY, partial [Kiritimatiellia bacterium]
MKIKIQNHQTSVCINPIVLQTLTKTLMQRAHRLDREAHWQQITIHLVDDGGIRSAHQAYFGKDTVTDVISQRYMPLPRESGCTGEIIINAQQALRAKKSRRWSWQRELALYLAHGIDHLHGSLDDTLSQQQRMRRRGQRHLLLVRLESQRPGHPAAAFRLRLHLHAQPLQQPKLG